jgi:disulfide bond formation protein DsbB
MKMHLLIRRFAGAFILISLLLAYYHSHYWLWVTTFVGFNLFQSSFTNFCPLEMILRKLGAGGSPGESDKTGGSCCAR